MKLESVYICETIVDSVLGACSNASCDWETSGAFEESIEIELSVYYNWTHYLGSSITGLLVEIGA